MSAQQRRSSRRPRTRVASAASSSAAAAQRFRFNLEIHSANGSLRRISSRIDGWVDVRLLSARCRRSSATRSATPRVRITSRRTMAIDLPSRCATRRPTGRSLKYSGIPCHALTRPCRSLPGAETGSSPRQLRVPPRAAAEQRTASARLRPLRMGGRGRRVRIARRGLVGSECLRGRRSRLRARVTSSIVARRSRLNEIAVSDQGTYKGLTQFLTQSLDVSPQIAEDKSICGTAGFEGGFCAALFQTVRNLLILKRRDAGAVDQARLEIGSLHAR